jgi:hypothetical protein
MSKAEKYDPALPPRALVVVIDAGVDGGQAVAQQLRDFGTLHYCHPGTAAAIRRCLQGEPDDGPPEENEPTSE